MTPNWLHAYLIESVRKDLCMRIGCATCGALQFRQGVVKALASVTGAGPSGRMPSLDARAIARALSEVQAEDAVNDRVVDPVMCLLVDVCGKIGEAETATILAGSWGGSLLRRMQEHDAARTAASRERAVFEANAQARREEEKRLKQEQHHERLTRKRERDRVRREQAENAASDDKGAE